MSSNLMMSLTNLEKEHQQKVEKINIQMKSNIKNIELMSIEDLRLKEGHRQL